SGRYTAPNLLIPGEVSDTEDLVYHFYLESERRELSSDLAPYAFAQWAVQFRNNLADQIDILNAVYPNAFIGHLLAMRQNNLSTIAQDLIHSNPK
ncbi:MAG: hypothetical protein AABZ57_06580, partial [Candidatus Margulisiibacteriota bacterium]